MLAVSSLNTLSVVSFQKHYQMAPFQMKNYSQILLEFETFKRIKEDLREKSKMSLEKTDNMKTQANALLRRNNIGVPA